MARVARKLAIGLCVTITAGAGAVAMPREHIGGSGAAPPPDPSAPPELTASIVGSGISEHPPEVARGIPAMLTARVNRIERGEVEVCMHQEDILIAVEHLDRLGLERHPPLTETGCANRRYYSLRAMAPKVRYALDAQALTVDITADPDLLPATSISLSRRNLPRGIDYRADSTAFLNYSVQADDLSSPSGFGELGINAANTLAISTVQVSKERGPVRGLSSVVWDEREHLIRTTLGDSFANTGLLGGSGVVAGLSIAKNFDIDPYLQTTPSIAAEGTALVPSTVEVYVNDTLVHRSDVAPGRFDLDNIPASAGAGDTRIVVRDALGNQQQITSTFYQPAGNLAAGLSQYSYHLGALRRQSGTESWNYDEPVFLGSHRVGVSNALTLIGRGEASLDFASGGAGASFLLPFGQAEVMVAGSREQKGVGAAGSLAYRYQSRHLSFAGFGRYLSPRYRSLEDVADEDRVEYEAGGGVGLPINRWLSLSAQGSARRYRDETWRRRMSLTTSSRLFGNLSANASYSVSEGRDGPRVAAGFVSLTWLFGERTSTTASQQQQQQGLATSLFAMQRSRPVGSGIGYRVSAQSGERNMGRGRIDAQSQYGRYMVELEADDSGQANRAQVAGGLVLIGGGLHASRPVQRSFALVRVPDVEGVPSLLNNNEVGRTNGDGEVLIPDLQAYYGNRISIRGDHLPLDYTIEGGEKVIAPIYRGGAVVEFKASRLHAVRGTISAGTQQGKSTAAFGTLRLASGEASLEESGFPLGPDGQFEVNGLMPGMYVAVVEHGFGSCTARLEIPERDAPIIELGSVRCESKKE